MDGRNDSADAARIARGLRQRLEVNRLFGWDLPISRGSLRRAAPAAKTSPKIPPGRSAPDPKTSPGRSAQDPKIPSGRSAPNPGASRGTGAEPAAPAGASREAREALLRPLAAEVQACTRCALCRTRTQTVFGVGDPRARLFFVGEAPGFDEDREGEPFVGKAGRLLTDIIKAMGLRREDVYIANVIKCRPPQNRVPNPAEVGSCRGYLDRQIEIVSPEVIVVLGNVAARALLGSELGMARIRGRFHEYRGIPVMPTYHPAYLLRNPAEKRKVWEDIQVVMARLGLDRP